MLTPLRCWKGDVGREVRGVVIRPVDRDGRTVLPAGSVVRGRVARVEAVGMGIRRERARLEVSFTEWEKPGGDRGSMRARLTGLDNAREEVDGQGRIRGILAARNPMGLTRGVWFRPQPNLLVRGPAGLTGACGMAWARLALGPAGTVGLLGARVALTRMPQPEIDLPVGTELTLQVEVGLPEEGAEAAETELAIASETADFLEALPVGVRKANGERVTDVINLAFAGSREQLDGGFRAAGWVEADALTRGSFRRAYRAFTMREGYATAPVSKLYYDGRLPDVVYQKSLNSIGKRHHIRIWRLEEPGGRVIWVGAASHDISVAFDRRRLALTHRIDPELDREREKVVADLAFAGAVNGVGRVERVLQEESGRKTDGALRVAVLRGTNEGEELEWKGHPRPRPGAPFRLVRRMVLEARHYLLRDNPYYLGFAAARRWARR